VHITWFSWKDINHPEAGGAERVSDAIRKRLVVDGHRVTLITARYPGSQARETAAGVQTIRVGSRYSVYLKARRQYKKLPVQDLIIDEMNTIPFMASFYRGSAVPVLLTYQLARRVWFYQIAFPLSIIGYIVEPLYLHLISKRYQLVLTESNSTKQDLQRYGFREQDIVVFRVGMDIKRPAKLLAKKPSNTIIFLGALRPMKQPVDAIQAFEKACDQQPNLRLILAGNTAGSYAEKVRQYVKQSRHREAIDMRGRISEAEKSSLLQEAQLIIVTSIKEGWGLIVTEANSQGTPAIVYDTDGLRDSVQDSQTGLVVPAGDTTALSKALLELMANPQKREALRVAAFEHSKQFTYNQSYEDFSQALQRLKLPH
jgi:glycosyltransferase involved in cell wall biosynthesis